MYNNREITYSNFPIFNVKVSSSHAWLMMLGFLNLSLGFDFHMCINIIKCHFEEIKYDPSEKKSINVKYQNLYLVKYG